MDDITELENDHTTLSKLVNDALGAYILHGEPKIIKDGPFSIRYSYRDSAHPESYIFKIWTTTTTEMSAHQIKKEVDTNNIFIRYYVSPGTFTRWKPIIIEKLLTRYTRHGNPLPTTTFSTQANWGGGKRKYKHKRTRRGKRRTTRKR